MEKITQLKLAYYVALTQKNITEISGDKDNQKIVEYHQATTLKAQDDETPWCSSFVNWCYIVAGLVGAREKMLMLLKAAKYSDKQIDMFMKSADEYLKHAQRLDKEDLFMPQLPTRSAMARSWLLHGKRTSSPKEGDLVCFARGNNGISGHIAFFKSRGPIYVSAYGGNQGNMVCTSNYSRIKVLGYMTEG